MKRFCTLAALILAISSLVVAQDAKLAKKAGGATEQAVLKLEQEWVDALTRADTSALERIYADTLVYTHSSGSVDTKASYIANLKSGNTKYESLERDDVKVNVYDDAAVVTCHVLIKLNNRGTPSTVNARMIHVYAKQKGRWQMVAHQTTRLAQP